MKFLSDAQSPEPLVASLVVMGWDIQTARNHGLEMEKRDEKIVAAARAMGRIVLSFDMYEGETRVAVENELRQHGGKVITVKGGPSQQPDEAIGKLYYHRPKWRAFFTAFDGWVEIRDLATGQTACHIRRATDLDSRVQYDEIEQMKAYLKAQKPPRKKVKKPRQAQPGQVVTDFDGADLSGTMPGLLQENVQLA